MSESFAELLACFRNGMIQVGMTNRPLLKIRAENSKIVQNLFPPESHVNVNGNQDNRWTDKLNLSKKISEAKVFARCLRNNDRTVSMCYEDKEIIVIGKKVKPKHSKLIIGSNDIQIKNLRQLKKLDIEFFSA
jgi:hypothetical protein